MFEAGFAPLGVEELLLRVYFFLSHRVTFGLFRHHVTVVDQNHLMRIVLRVR